MKKGLVVLAAMLLVTGCIHGDDSVDTAELRITFSPNPVYRSGDGRWYYTVNVQETAGIGVSINGFKVVSYDSGGGFLSENSYFGSEFASWFNDCGGSGYYVGAHAYRCGEVWSSGTAGSREWIFYGLDDRGNAIAYSARVTIR